QQRIGHPLGRVQAELHPLPHPERGHVGHRPLAEVAAPPQVHRAVQEHDLRGDAPDHRGLPAERWCHEGGLPQAGSVHRKAEGAGQHPQARRT
ncbi:hypothetical protein KR067_005783, partial [Drosophila pandora]